MDDIHRSALYTAVLNDTAHARTEALSYWNDIGNNMTEGESKELDDRMEYLRKQATRSTSLALLSLDEADDRAVEIYKNSVAQEILQEMEKDDDDDDEEEEA